MPTWSYTHRLTGRWSECVVSDTPPRKRVVTGLAAARAPKHIQTQSLVIHHAAAPLQTQTEGRLFALAVVAHRLTGSKRNARDFAKHAGAQIAAFMWNSARRRIQRYGGRRGYPRTKPTALPNGHKSANHRLSNWRERGGIHEGPAGKRDASVPWSLSRQLAVLRMLRVSPLAPQDNAAQSWYHGDIGVYGGGHGHTSSVCPRAYPRLPEIGPESAIPQWRPTEHGAPCSASWKGRRRCAGACKSRQKYVTPNANE